jgi:hypothetical protein
MIGLLLAPRYCLDEIRDAIHLRWDHHPESINDLLILGSWVCAGARCSPSRG